MSNRKRPVRQQKATPPPGTDRPPFRSQAARAGAREAPAANLFSALDEARGQTIELFKQLAEHAEQSKALATALSRHEQRLDRLVQSLLPVLDTFDNLVSMDPDVDPATYQSSVQAAGRALERALAANQVELVGEVGQAFDPDLHMVISTVSGDDVPPDTVVRVLQRGVRYQGKLIRSANVVTAIPEASGSAAAVATSTREEA